MTSHVLLMDEVCECGCGAASAQSCAAGTGFITQPKPADLIKYFVSNDLLFSPWQVDCEENRRGYSWGSHQE